MDTMARARVLALAGIEVRLSPSMAQWERRDDGFEAGDLDFDETAEAVLDALDEFERSAGGDWAERAAHDVSKELRIPSGKGGGRWTKSPITSAIAHALEEWARGDGPDDPFVFDGKPIDREPLRKAAVARGITLKRGASRDDIVAALKADVGVKVRDAKAAKPPEAGKPVKFTLKGKDHRNLDVGVYSENGKVSLWEVSDSGERRRRVALVDDLAGLEKWADDNGETQLADWARKERGGAEAPKAAAPAKRAPAAKVAESAGIPVYTPPESLSPEDRSRAKRLVRADPQIFATVQERHGPISTSGNLSDEDAAWLQSVFEREPAFVNRLAQDAYIDSNLRRAARQADQTPTEFNAAVAGKLRGIFADKPIALRVSDEAALRGILNDGKFKTQFDAGAKRAGDLRIDVEHRRLGEQVMGVAPDTPPDQRPIYGYVAINGIEPALSPGKAIPGIAQREGQEDVLSQYGKVQVVLKPGVRGRTTATVGDSLDQLGIVQPSPVDHPSAGSAGVGYSFKIDNLDRLAEPGWTRHSYVEAQIHGGVKTGDIAEVVFPSQPDSATRSALADADIPWRVLTPGQATPDVPAKATKAAKKAAPDEGAAAHGAALIRKPLDRNALATIEDYHGGNAAGMNRALRTGRGVVDPANADAARLTRGMDNLMAGQELARPIAVDRGVVYGDLVDMIGGEPKPGATFVDHGFASTTTTGRPRLRPGEDNAVLHVQVPAGVRAVSTAQSGGFDSFDPGEVVLDRGLTYRVTKVDVRDGVRHVDVEVVPPGMPPRAAKAVEKAAPEPPTSVAGITIDSEAPDFERLTALANARTVADLRAVAAANNVRIPSYIKSKEDMRRHLALEMRYPAGMDFAEYEAQFTGASAAPAAAPADLAHLRTLDREVARDELDLRKVDELKALLREQGLPVSGRKRDLVDRLVDSVHGGGTPTESAAAILASLPADLTPAQKRARLRSRGVPTEEIDALVPVPTKAPRTPLGPGGADDLAEEFYRHPNYTEQQIHDRLAGLNLAELKKVAKATNVPLPRDLVKTEAGPVFQPLKKVSADELRKHIASTLARDRKLLASEDKLKAVRSADAGDEFDEELDEDTYDDELSPLELEAAEDPTLDEIHAMAAEDNKPNTAARARQLALLGVTRALGHDVTPGHERLHHYWTRGPGLPKWIGSKTQFRTLRALLAKATKGKVSPEALDRFAASWVHEVTGFWPGSDMHRVLEGGKPRGHRIGPG